MPWHRAGGYQKVAGTNKNFSDDAFLRCIVSIEIEHCGRLLPFELTACARQETSFVFPCTAQQSALDSDLVDCLHRMRRAHANLLQFFVGEVHLFLVAGAF